jgi:alpha-tubulin suppressor-like RCC1 family protein
MNLTRISGCAVLLVSLLLAACGGSGGSSDGTSKTTTTVGAAGGTVNGPDGLILTIPAGALDSNVEIGIKRAGSDAPDLPDGADPTTPMYEFTPHGIVFKEPVLVSMPAGSGTTPTQAFMYEQGGSDWHAVLLTSSGGRWSWPLTGFSWGTPPYGCIIPADRADDPYPCVGATAQAPNVTATPSAAMTSLGWYSPGGQALYPRFSLSEEAQVQWHYTVKAAADCGGATVKFIHWRPDVLGSNGYPLQTVIAEQSVAMAAVGPSDPHRVVGTAAMPAYAFDYANRATHYFGATFRCTRGYRYHNHDINLVTVDAIRVDTGNLALAAAPAITQQPADQTVTEPATATFTATSDKPTATVKWQRSNDGGATWGDIPGATSASYTTPATTTADSGAQFLAIFTNANGPTPTNAATLTVNPTPAYPVVVTHPTSQSVAVGATATFSVSVTGTPTPGLQWQVSTDGGATWTDIPGATGTSYTTPATTAGDNGKEYRVIATNGSGSAGSASATLTVSASLALLPYGKISALNAHTCAVTGGGSIYCWGNGGNGELGYGTAEYSSRPVRATGITNAEFVSAGGNSTCAIHGGGQLSCWGFMNDSLSPSSMGVSNAAWVAVGMSHACYVTTGGEIWCWGSNNYGQLGDGTQTNTPSPVQVKWANGTAVTGAVSVAAGMSFTCARMTGGEVYCWGIDSAYNARTSPVRVVRRLPNSQTMDFTITGHIAAGLNNACAIEGSAGQTVCWGFNPLGQLGDNTTNSRDTAVTVGRYGNGMVAAGTTHSCSIDSAVGSSLLCWGNGYFGNGSGLQTVLDAGSAVRVGTYYNNSTVVTAVAAGDRYTCALLAVSGDVQCWGLGNAGQIGNNDTLDVTTPTSTSAGTIFWTP